MKRIISGMVLLLILMAFWSYSIITNFLFNPNWLNPVMAIVWLVLLILTVASIACGWQSRQEKNMPS